MNKISKQAKRGISIRVITAIFIALYLSIVFVFAAFSDPLSSGGNGWTNFLSSASPWVPLLFAVLFILSFTWFSYFIAKELCGAYFKTKNWKLNVIVAVILLIIQLVPTACYLPFVYYYYQGLSDHLPPLILVWIYAATSIGCAFIAYGFLFWIAKRAHGATRFSLITFPLTIIGIAWSFSLLYYLTINHQWSTILVILVAICACDIFAFFGGSLFGKHKMAPNISPKKTWEGAIIGAVIAVGLGTLIVYLISLYPNNEPRYQPKFLFFGVQLGSMYAQPDVVSWMTAVWWIAVVLLLIVMVIAGIIGDLYFSLIKRKTKIKDFGSILPGHGGFLDRMDSFLFAVLVFGGITIFISFIVSMYNGADHMFLPQMVESL